MTIKTGAPARIGSILPGATKLSKIPKLSKEAKDRLRWIDYYHQHGCNARLSCRHFGIAHRSFYRYYSRYRAMGLRGLETRSHRPTNIRKPTTPPGQIDLVRQLRRDNPEYSKYKLQVILKRDHSVSLSASTIGRIISRYNLFFTPPVKPKAHPNRVARRRKPADLRPKVPGELIEFDVKHLPVLGTKRYGFVAIDVVSKQTVIHVASTVSSVQAVQAWKKLCLKMGKPQAVLNDNGSENLGKFASTLKEAAVDHYFARPRTPKDKPHVERMIGSLERECIQWGGIAIDLVDQQAIIDAWLDKYHNYRPHQALGYLTPNEYMAKLDSEVALII